jgi:hypothetical protein
MHFQFGSPERLRLPREIRRNPTRRLKCSVPDTIRTYDQRFRKALLYPTELRRQTARLRDEPTAGLSPGPPQTSRHW